MNLSALKGTFAATYTPFKADGSIDEAAYRRAVAGLSSPQCLQCINPRCADDGCPLHNRIPVWVELAYQGLWRQAAEDYVGDGEVLWVKKLLERQIMTPL